MANQPFQPAEKLKPENVLPKEENWLEADEKALESLPESKDTFLEKAEAAEKAPVTKVIEGVPATAAAAPAVPKDEVTLEVEKIMEQGLGAYYAKLPPQAKEKFKTKGEQTAHELSGMVRNFKVKFKQALAMIRDWLLCIPGINKFFLEQEAKIKVDRIIELVEARKKEASKQP